MLVGRQSKNILSSVTNTNIKRCLGTAPEDSGHAQFVYNRNPRNLEKLRIAYKPAGYHLEKPGREFWHKLQVTTSKRHVTASVLHHTGVVPVMATTAEWAVRKQLFSTLDKMAYITIGKVLAQRCLECGISDMINTYEVLPNSKLEALLENLLKGGIRLEEDPRYKSPNPWDQERPEKPWEHY
ncbi:39S ribosomal protein L18, mitochondrial isoform X1 [Acyrthosiphon pisum]|uniref:Large ribosomal subunit protein uL18m n=1 Tax=Acyrthosiphon pisum TaxID=7029 RepID=C4WWP0_ACYPI|nr:39S ribosomal protein L18, mitochondrial [Acyrthosiphon pisum]XP_003248776.1 39S ribosomal protein L18, mitochondrial [Acyrthosiphon pisum]XP_029341954.1 39S ribosomal protein L18, mitochondrial isoform X1 [Acyrthosiphon pisum]BAH72310.1 ACYPI006860 [Acyrthosiphon pisum]|eukprot:NP_001155682.1 39S ribosomal protein L18, mitochondrial [Acyrthosiphon pisum]